VITKLFTADGKQFHESNVTNPNDNTIASEPVVAAMQGRYIVAWTERLPDDLEPDPPLGLNVKAQVLTEPIGDPGHDAPGPVMNIGTGLGNQDQPAIAAIFAGNDANVAVAWIDDSVLGPDANRRCVQAKTFHFV
jgi:hypothetical protein